MDHAEGTLMLMLLMLSRMHNPEANPEANTEARKHLTYAPGFIVVLAAGHREVELDGLTPLTSMQRLSKGTHIYSSLRPIESFIPNVFHPSNLHL